MGRWPVEVPCLRRPPESGRADGSQSALGPFSLDVPQVHSSRVAEGHIETPVRGAAALAVGDDPLAVAKACEPLFRLDGGLICPPLLAFATLFVCLNGLAHEVRSDGCRCRRPRGAQPAHTGQCRVAGGQQPVEVVGARAHVRFNLDVQYGALPWGAAISVSPRRSVGER